MARLPQLVEVAEKFDLKIVSIADLIAYRLKHESLIERKVEVDFNTVWGSFKMVAYRQTTTDEEHLVIYKGDWEKGEDVLVRVESSSFTHNLLDAVRSDKQSRISAALKMIEENGRGAIVFIQQEEKQIGLVEKLQAYNNGTKSKPKSDQKDYGIGAQILRDLNIEKLKLISNNQNMNTSVINAYGLEVSQVIPFNV